MNFLFTFCFLLGFIRDVSLPFSGIPSVLINIINLTQRKILGRCKLSLHPPLLSFPSSSLQIAHSPFGPATLTNACFLFSFYPSPFLFTAVYGQISLALPFCFRIFFRFFSPCAVEHLLSSTFPIPQPLPWCLSRLS